MTSRVLIDRLAAVRSTAGFSTSHAVLRTAAKSPLQQHKIIRL